MRVDWAEFRKATWPSFNGAAPFQERNDDGARDRVGPGGRFNGAAPFQERNEPWDEVENREIPTGGRFNGAAPFQERNESVW